mgnify:CR=1 FL=1
MSIKDDLLKEIEEKANKIRQKRKHAIENKTIEAVVFTFFKNIEESRSLHNGAMYNPYLFRDAHNALIKKIKLFDAKASFDIMWTNDSDIAISFTNTVQGILITWSNEYIQKNNIEPTRYIDVSEMLFI